VGWKKEEDRASWVAQGKEGKGESRAGWAAESWAVQGKREGTRRRRDGPAQEGEREGKINAIHMHLNLNLKFKFKWNTTNKTMQRA
jgi:hypothetical protein